MPNVTVGSDTFTKVNVHLIDGDMDNDVDIEVFLVLAESDDTGGTPKH